MTKPCLITALSVAFDLHKPVPRVKDHTDAEWRTLNAPRSSLLNDSWPHKVLAFRNLYQRRVGTDLIDGRLTDGEIQSHEGIITEEWNEFWTAVMGDDLIETLDGGIDLIYTVLGLLIHRGIPPHIIDAAMEEIHASNMTKAGEDGAPLLSPKGKILKGPRYVKANLELAALKATPSFNLVPTEESDSDAITS